MRMKGKVAIVTGAGSGGCGQAIARRFSREGAAVVVSDSSEAGIAATVAGIREEGGRAEPLLADVTVEEEVDGLIDYATHAFGGLDVLVNCASATYRPDPLLEGWRSMVEVDLLGAMYLTRYAIASMLKRTGGAIIHFGSTSGMRHSASRAPAYDVAKAGVMRLATSLGWLKDAHGIRVNCIVPDWIATPQVVEYVNQLTAEQRQAENVPPLTPIEEIVEGVLRLTNDESLAGRALVCWSGRQPGLIPTGDSGYSALYPLAELIEGRGDG
jgi:NAD(P)-dependent dehydrogenase (short-subunit alcohol dehydrogenase family)